MTQENSLKIEREHAQLSQRIDELNKKKVELEKRIESFRTSSLDINKFSFEAMKHLTTLSAGSIVLLVTFLDKLFSTGRDWIGFVEMALVLFVLAIICAMFSLMQWTMVMTLFIADKPEVKSQARRQHRVEQMAFLAFTLGIVCLVIFALKNLY